MSFRLLSLPRYFRAPDDGGAAPAPAASGSEPAPSPAPDGGAAPSPAPDGGGGDDAPNPLMVGFDARPDNLPEGYWNDDTKTANVEQMLSDLADAREAVQGQEGNRVPEGGYQLKVPEGLEGVIEVDTEHPLFKPFTEACAKANLAPEVVNEIAAPFYQQMAQGLADEAEFDKSEEEAKVKHFSAGGARTKEQALAKAEEVKTWATNVLAADLAANPALKDAIDRQFSVTDGYILFDLMQKRIGEKTNPTTPGAGAAQDPVNFYAGKFADQSS